ncbi:uncharacterized protein LOC143623162 [Bidens hawaiensis]|uniref:uncharacterized protein LOC143623162 n=1 Tax=Bidens hawaiensis TaxID=980011 RepID=UPI004049C5BC
MEFADLSGNKIYLTLWDDYLKQLTKYVADNPNEEYLIIVIMEEMLFEISSKVDVEVPKPVGSSMLLIIKDEFLKKFLFYSISDLCTILEAKNVIIIGTVKVYECKNSSCNSLGVTAGPRFRIPIHVQDTIGVVSLTLFDRDARQLFNKAADEFVTSDVELEPMHTFLEELNIILEKKFAFIVEVSDYNIRNSYDVYGVTKLTDDEDVLNDLDKQLANGQSLTVGSTSGLKSTEKELLTPLSDHFTPLSNSEDVIPDRLSSLDGKDISLPMIDVKLKRKLDDTYDGQDDTGMSATKTKVDEQPTVDANVADGDIVQMKNI